ATSASLGYVYGLAVDAAGNLYIADTSNSRIRRVAAETGIITTVAGNGTFGVSGDGGPAAYASVNNPLSVAVDVAGTLYIGDYSHRMRKVAAATGIITTVAGNGTPGLSGDGGPATNASIAGDSVAVDRAGNLYLPDLGRIRKVAAATGIITTVAGNGTP